jgi:hypothetical protein
VDAGSLDHDPVEREREREEKKGQLHYFNIGKTPAKQALTKVQHADHSDLSMWPVTFANSSSIKYFQWLEQTIVHTQTQ